MIKNLKKKPILQVVFSHLIIIAMILSFSLNQPLYAGNVTTNATSSTTNFVIRNKVSDELQKVISANPFPDYQWTMPGSPNLVKVLVVCQGSDTSLASLKSLIVSGGGSIHFQFLAVNAFSAVMPASMVLTIAQRSEVVSISPNLQTQRSGELLEDTTGASIARTAAAVDSSPDSQIKPKEFHKRTLSNH